MFGRKSSIELKKPEHFDRMRAAGSGVVLATESAWNTTLAPVLQQHGSARTVRFGHKTLRWVPFNLRADVRVEKEDSP